MAVDKKTNDGFSPAAILIAVWAAVLLIAFFANRGEDVGKLGQLFGDFGGGPLFGLGIFDSFVGSVVALLIAVSWFGMGSGLTSSIRITHSEEHSHILELVIKMAVGAAAWSLLWFLLGLTGEYNGTMAVLALAIGVVSAVYHFRRLREAKEESRVPEKPSGFDKALLLLIAIPVVLAFVASLAPPTAKDTLLYHFSVPKAFIAQGSNAFIEGNIASYLALGTEMHTVWAMLLGNFVSQRGGEAAAGATIWMFLPLLLAAIFGWAREVGVERRWALIAVLMVASVPTVYHVAASAYIDVALALFVTLAIYALTRWWKTLETGWLIFVAIFLGAALSAKLTTVVVIAAFALVILLRVRKAQEVEPDKVGKIAGLGFAALILAGVIASPWYLRTWAETGSPVFPFYMSIWPGEAAGWDVERSGLFQVMNSQYGSGSLNAFDEMFGCNGKGVRESRICLLSNPITQYLVVPLTLSTAAQPELASLFDGVLGLGFLFGLPILIFGLWKFDLPVEIKIGVGIAAIMFLFWLFSSQQLRYLLPMLPVITIAVVVAVTRITEKHAPLYNVSKYAITFAAIAGLLVSTAWFLQKAPVRVVLGGENREDYLTRNIDYYPYYQWLNAETPTDAKVWLINMRRDTYNLDRPYFSDYLFEDWTLKRLVWESRNEQELRAKAAAMGVQYILTRHDFLFDYARSPLVDDAKPKAENEARLQMAKGLILDPARTVKADQKFSLVKVF